MRKLKSKLSIVIMFSGILIGLVILLIKSGQQVHSTFQTLKEFPRPEISFQKKGHPLQELVTVLKAKHRIYQLMKKDTITGQDSLDIKAIDQQLNQLLHD